MAGGFCEEQPLASDTERMEIRLSAKQVQREVMRAAQHGGDETVIVFGCRIETSAEL